MILIKKEVGQDLNTEPYDLDKDTLIMITGNCPIAIMLDGVQMPMTNQAQGFFVTPVCGQYSFKSTDCCSGEVKIFEEECPPCEGYIQIEDFFADDIPELDPFNEMIIEVPACCELTIVTSHGQFTLQSKKSPYIFNPGVFRCFIESLDIQGSDECLAKTHVIIKR